MNRPTAERIEELRRLLATCRYCTVPLEIVRLDEEDAESPLVSRCPKCRRVWGRIAT